MTILGRKIDEENILISDCYIPIKNIRCYLNVEDIIRYWQQLEKKFFFSLHIKPSCSIRICNSKKEENIF